MKTTVQSVKEFDEKNQISATAQATASAAVEKAKEIDSKYEISASFSKALSLGVSAFSSGVQKFSAGRNSTTESSPNEPTDDIK